jgi:cytosine/creatinine deaminase
MRVFSIFPQEGLTSDPGTEELLVEALRDGARSAWGGPYTVGDPKAQIGPAKLENLKN